MSHQPGVIRESEMSSRHAAKGNFICGANTAWVTWPRHSTGPLLPLAKPHRSCIQLSTVLIQRPPNRQDLLVLPLLPPQFCTISVVVTAQEGKGMTEGHLSSSQHDFRKGIEGNKEKIKWSAHSLQRKWILFKESKFFPKKVNYFQRIALWSTRWLQGTTWGSLPKILLVGTGRECSLRELQYLRWKRRRQPQGWWKAE